MLPVSMSQAVPNHDHHLPWPLGPNARDCLPPQAMSGNILALVVLFVVASPAHVPASGGHVVGILHPDSEVTSTRRLYHTIIWLHCARSHASRSRAIKQSGRIEWARWIDPAQRPLSCLLPPAIVFIRLTSAASTFDSGAGGQVRTHCGFEDSQWEPLAVLIPSPALASLGTSVHTALTWSSRPRSIAPNSSAPFGIDAECITGVGRAERTEADDNHR
ncbi:hypothetical protein OF83DRAFT_1178238 [Amylostereum chailletii]|nr:hypothetical protein OF83DRAFT_1178238 [Amylostereum chailletii]